MNDKQAREYLEGIGADWEDRFNHIRFCWDCWKWVHVDDYNDIDDCCDVCANK